MGFWQGFGRVLAGKPVFEPGDISQPEQQQAAQAGGKVVPVIRIGRVECPAEGADMDVYADLHNESPVRVYIDKMSLLGTTEQLDMTLQPGEVKQFHVYRGPRPHNDDMRDAEVEYRDDSDNYFAAHHEVQFKAEPDNTFLVWEFHLITPIKELH